MSQSHRIEGGTTDEPHQEHFQRRARMYVTYRRRGNDRPPIPSYDNHMRDKDCSDRAPRQTDTSFWLIFANPSLVLSGCHGAWEETDRHLPGPLLEGRICKKGGEGWLSEGMVVRLGRGKQTGWGVIMNRLRCYPCGNGPPWYWGWPLRFSSPTSAGCFSFFLFDFEIMSSSLFFPLAVVYRVIPLQSNFIIVQCVQCVSCRKHKIRGKCENDIGVFVLINVAIFKFLTLVLAHRDRALYLARFFFFTVWTE